MVIRCIRETKNVQYSAIPTPNRFSNTVASIMSERTYNNDNNTPAPM